MTALLIVSLPWLAYFTYAQDLERVTLVLICMAGQVIGLTLFWVGRHYLARIFSLAALVATFTVAACYLGGAGSPDLLFVVLLGLPFLFFSRRNEWFTLIAFVALTFGTAVFAFAFDLLDLRALFLSSPPPPLDAPELHSFGLKLTVAILVALEIGYFAWITEQATVASERALQKSDAAVRAKGAFLANMSHEIRTPMNGMMGMIDVLETMHLNDRQARVIGTIRNSASALLRIINDILDASKIDAGKLDVENAKVELRPLVEGVAQTMQTTADDADVRIRLLTDPDLPEWIMMDSGRLRQVLLNLLSNGVKYSSKRLTGRQGEVQVLAEQGPEGTLRFCITDNGVGMDPDFMDR
ncbi:MAG: histidine kinase dimerization/phospho-acceptor domain-containing protein, partial [Thalassovita sp.]|nr:histidine kinase dimerization/phospho-acceptor domain-containing protein [Thalassovita sp.]